MATNQFTITEGEEVKQVGVKPADLVAFERKYGMSFSDTIDEIVDPETEEITRRPSAKARIEHTYFLVWNALRRTGQETRSFDEFIDNVDEINDPDSEDVEESHPLD